MSQAVLPQLHGVLVVNKPAGITSNQCLSRIKRLGQKKIGHAGTLDPMAQGVLLVLLGQATKLSTYLLQGGGKVYSGVCELGVVTDTWDKTGTVLEQKPFQNVTEEDVRASFQEECQKTEQTVPPYSAAKKDGTPLYKLARAGTYITRTKNISITQAEVLSFDPPFVHFRVACSSGTYIRSLAHSLGTRLGCGAVLTELTREYSFPFGLAEACDLSALLEDPKVLVHALKPMRSALPNWPCVELADVYAQRLRQGQSVPCCDSTEASHPYAIALFRQCELALLKRSREAGETVWKVLRGLWNDETP